MKNLMVITFLCFVMYSAYGQKNIEYIKVQIENIDFHLVKKGEHLKLNNAQLDALYKVFDEKHARYESIIAGNKDKSDVSNALTKLDEEFAPRVSAVLDLNQRVSLMKKEKNKAVQSGK